MRKPLTKRQKEILAFIQQHLDAHGYPPTVREIGNAVHLSSSSTVHTHLKNMEEQGLIQREAVLTRAIKVVDSRSEHALSRKKPITYVPLVGTVAAGKPTLATEDVEEVFPLPQSLAPPESFMLRVKGDSMIEDGIFEGDFVIVRRQDDAANGEMIVALVTDESTGSSEATVKRFYKEANRIRLQPANASMQPLYFPDVRVAGKVVGLIRNVV